MSNNSHINAYNDYVTDLRSKELNFKVEMSGMSRIVHFLDGYGNTTRKRIFYGAEGDERIEGLEFVMMVRREIKKLIKEGQKPPVHVQGTKVVSFNIDNLKKAHREQEELFEIDLNACYWKTASNLGFISDDLFIKGWKKRKSCKLGLVASIGSLNKRTFVETYDFGKSQGLIEKTKDHDLRPYYWAIINEVNRIMNESIKMLPKHHFMMWLTDCMYLKQSSKSIITDHFNSLGYEFKTNTCHISKVERNRVYWVNHNTGEEKYIFYSVNTALK